jgi:Family of unknown function (DUF6519)
MKGDFSRKTFDPDNHYSRVLQQQGRVQLDADWNEQVAIDAHLRETGVRDVVGPAGAPMDGGGFRIEATTDGGRLVISPGRFWVAGILCELPGGVVSLGTTIVTPVPAPVPVPVTEPPVTQSEAASRTTTTGDPSETPVPFPDVPSVPPTFKRTFSTDDDRRLGVTPGDSVKLLFLDDLGRENEAGLYQVISKAPVAGGVEITFAGILFPGSSQRLRRETDYFRQPDFPGATDPGDGTYLAYLDVWLRHITCLDDPRIRETALGGPDTATRAQVMAQVRLLSIGTVGEVDFAGNPLTCESKPDLWAAGTAAPAGRMSAQAVPVTASADLCSFVSTGAGYTGLANQLYRVEIHDDGTVAGKPPTFKWSRDNGSLVTRWVDGLASGQIQIADPGRDSVLSFQTCDWVELIEESAAVDGRKPGELVQIDTVTGDLVTFKAPSAQVTTWIAAFQTFHQNPTAALPPRIQMRRWDMPHTSSGAQPVGSGSITLENGLQISFTPGTFRTGDYWLIPARTFINAFPSNLEWPQDGQGHPLALPPHGIKHHYAKLAVVERTGGSGAPHWSVRGDCRDLFPPLTGLLHLEKLCGDGQEALPGETLSEPLRLAVLNGGLPMPEKKVRVQVTTGGGSLSALILGQLASGASLDLTTGLDGTVECSWSLGPHYGDQHVLAWLLDDGGTPAGPGLCFEARQIVPRLQVLCGNGQQARPHQALPQALSVRVTAGALRPLEKWTVRFEVREGGGSFPDPGQVIIFDEAADRPVSSTPSTPLIQTLDAVTDANGIASMQWILGAAPAQHVEATLLFPVDGALQPLGSPVCFTATLSVASEVAYTPGSCRHLAGAATVQAALDKLCANIDLAYAGGDGQTGLPGQMLPLPLEVRVSNGHSAEPGATVEFKIQRGSGTISRNPQGADAGAVLQTQTNPGGLAYCFWTLDPSTPSPVVSAQLILPGPVPSDAIMYFGAALAPPPPPRFFVETVYLNASDLQNRNELLNDTVVNVNHLAAGLDIVCTAPLAPEPFSGPPGFESDASVAPKPVLLVALDVPWSATGTAVAFQTIYPQAKVYAAGSTISWRPSVAASAWLKGLFVPPAPVFPQGAAQPAPAAKIIGTVDQVPAPAPLRVRLTLEGNFVWTPASGDPAAYLAGEPLGKPVPAQKRVDIRRPAPPTVFEPDTPATTSAAELTTAAAPAAARSAAATAVPSVGDLPIHPRQPTLLSTDRAIPGRFQMWFWITAPKEPSQPPADLGQASSDSAGQK